MTLAVLDIMPPSENLHRKGAAVPAEQERSLLLLRPETPTLLRPELPALSKAEPPIISPHPESIAAKPTINGGKASYKRKR